MPSACRRPSQRVRAHRLAGGLVDDQVPEPDGGRMPSRVGGMMALDRRRDRASHAPPPDQHRAHKRMIDPELAALAPHPFVGALIATVAEQFLAVELDQHEPADVVQQRGDRELVGLGQPRELPDPLGGVSDCDGVAAKTLVAVRPRTRMVEQIVGVESGGERANTVDVQGLDRLTDAARAPRGAAAVVGGPHDRDREPGVGLDRLGDFTRGSSLALAEAEQAAPRLGQRRQPGDRLEGRRQPPATASGPTHAHGAARAHLGHRFDLIPRYRAMRGSLHRSAAAPDLFSPDRRVRGDPRPPAGARGPPRRAPRRGHARARPANRRSPAKRSCP